MKKYINILLLLVLICGITGCGTIKKETTNKIHENSKVTDDNKGENDMSINKQEVVLYFSATGTTEKVAKKIA